VTTLTAIVPATDRPPTLEDCLAAIKVASRPPEEVIVAEEPVGATPAAARNRAAARATGEVLVFVDADVVVHPDVFLRIRDAFDADAELAALFGSYDDAPGARGVVSTFRNLLHHHVHQSSPGQAATFWSGLGAVRRREFAAAGGFEDDRRWLEDVELGARLNARGAHVELDPAIQGTHLKAWSLAGMVKMDFAQRGIPWVQLALSGRAPSDALNLRWRHRLSAALSAGGLLALLTRRPLRAMVAVLGLVALNRSFYALLARRQGPVRAAAGVGLHAVHHLAGAAAVPAGIALYALRRRRSDEPSIAASTASAMRSAGAGYV
jgi:glycosyltransferase involved in cell wall biosynthesis